MRRVGGALGLVDGVGRPAVVAEEEVEVLLTKGASKRHSQQGFRGIWRVVLAGGFAVVSFKRA